MKLGHVYILICRGIGEPLDENTLLGQLRKMLPRTKFTFIDIAWAASYGPVPKLDGIAYAASLEGGMGRIYAALMSIPAGSRAILVGYSGGAALAGNWVAHGRNWAAQQGFDNSLMWKLIGCGLVADPLRPEGAGDGIYTAPGFGIAGQRPVVGNAFDTWWLTDPADMIGASERNSMVRPVADITYAVSFAPGAAPAFIRDIESKIRENRWQPIEIPIWNIPAVIAQFNRARHDVDGYLRRGDHTSYAVRNVPGQSFTYLDALCSHILTAVENTDGDYLDRQEILT